MRHGVAGNKFGRNQKLREATLRDLAKAVFTHQRIRTTLAKAIEARKLVDKLITKGKKNTLAAKRQVYAVLCDHALVSTLFNVIAPLFANRHGGYTRIIKFATNRGGDNARMVLLELTEKSVVVTAVDQKSANKNTSNVEDAVVSEVKAPVKKTRVTKALPVDAKKEKVKTQKKSEKTKKADKKD